MSELGSTVVQTVPLGEVHIKALGSPATKTTPNTSSRDAFPVSPEPVLYGEVVMQAGAGQGDDFGESSLSSTPGLPSCCLLAACVLLGLLENHGQPGVE